MPGGLRRTAESSPRGPRAASSAFGTRSRSDRSGKPASSPAPSRRLAFDPDGRVLAIGGRDGTIRLRAVPHAKALGLPLRVNHPVQSVMFREDGRRLLIGTTAGPQWLDLTGPKLRESGQGADNRSNDGALDAGRGHGDEPRRPDPGDRAVRGGRGPDSLPGRAAGCGHGELAASDARSARRALGPGVQPRLEVAADLGSRPRLGPALGRRDVARFSPPFPLAGIADPPGRLQP